MSQIKVNSLVPTGGLGTGAFGGIIQVVPAFTTASTTVTNQTLDINGLTVTISPSSTNSKFLIMACFSIAHTELNGSVVLDLVRNNTAIAQGVNTTQGSHTSLLSMGGAGNGNVFNYSYQHVDQTTLTDLSDITYKYTIASVAANFSAYANTRATNDMTATGNLIVCEVSG